MSRQITFLPADAGSLKAACTAYRLGAEPKHHEWKTAIGLQKALEAVTDIEPKGMTLRFDSCSLAHELGESDVRQLAGPIADFILSRAMPQAAIDAGCGVVLFLEDAQFEYLKNCIQKIIPRPAVLEHFLRLEEILDDKELCQVVDLKKLTLGNKIVRAADVAVE